MSPRLRVLGHRYRVCYIHIGTHKTATTSLQCFLSGNRKRFAENGVFFPTAGCDEDETVAHHQLAKELIGLSTFDPNRGGLKAVADELRQTDADVVCLTSELFSFLHDAPDSLVRLRDALQHAGFVPRIVVYLRAQASYCSALYAENVRQGYRTTFDQYFSDVLDHGRYFWNGGSGPPFDYTVLLDGFAAVFGTKSIIAFRYRSGAADKAVFTLLSKLLLPRGTDLDGFDFPKIRHNGSLTFVDVLRLLGADHELEQDLRFAPIDFRKALRLGVRFLRSNSALAWRYRVLVPIFERIDIALAAPLGPNRSTIAALARARRALAIGAVEQRKDHLA